MITAVVFSRDRAMQLDLLLRSMPDGFDTTVLWKATTDGHETAYLTCAREHPEATLIMESPDGLVWRVQDILEDTNELACFLTDDSVFYRPPTIPVALHHHLLCYSFRLGKNTSWCYPHSRKQVVPDLYDVDGYEFIWKWEGADGDFGYPASLDGHVFRAAHLRRALMTCNPQANPNRIEEHLDRWVRARLAAEYPLMTAETESSLVGIPVNRVNETHPNRYAQKHSAHFPTDELCVRYLEGERIAFDQLDFSEVRGAHQEIPLVFR